jgi:hypothetical protein
VLVAEHAVEDEDFLATGMNMRVEAGARRPADQRRGDAIEFNLKISVTGMRSGLK